MEPKNPIIINGVDVSGCIFHSLTTMGYAGFNYCKCFECVCKGYNNCYYKNWQRKEQENEELRQALIEIEDIAKEQMPYLNIDKSKTMIGIEYDYAGKIYILEQRMNKILQKISEVLDG